MRRAGLAAVAGLLGALSAYAAGPKSGGVFTLADDLQSGSAGTVKAQGGVYSVSGSVGQTATEPMAAGAALLESGYFNFGGNSLTPLPFTAVPGSSGTAVFANWSSAFPGGTQYYVDLSTGAFPNLNVGNTSTSTLNLSVMLTPLTAGTLYFARVSTDPAGPFTSLGSTSTSSGVLTGSIAALPYTAVYPNGLTANWSSTFPGGTPFYLQISTDGFATINSSVTTNNLFFAFNGLQPALSYNVRVSTDPSGASAVALGAQATPNPAAATVNFNFSGGSNLTTIASANGQQETGRAVLVDTVTAGGPYTYVLFESTSGALGYSPAVHALARFGPGGGVLSTAALAGSDVDISMTLDSAGNVYVAQRDAFNGSSWLSKFSSALVFQSSVSVPGAAVYKIRDLEGDGTSIYAAADGADNTAKLIKYGANLVAVATASYAIGGNPVTAGKLTLDAAGNVYLLASSATAGAPVHLLKYPAAFDLASPSADVVVPGLASTFQGSLAFSAGKLFVGADSGGGAVFTVLQYDAGLSYTGFSSTMTGLVAGTGAGLLAGPDQSVFVGGTLDAGGGGDYLVMKYNAANNLAFMSSATWNSPTFLSDKVGGAAVLNSTQVFVTGSSSQTIADANAVTVKMTLNAGGGGACAQPFAGGNFTAFSTSTLTVTWGSEPTCPAGTILTALISPTPFNPATIVATVTTAGNSATFMGLNPGTSYTAIVSTTGVWIGGLAIGPGSTLNTAALAITGALSYPGNQPGAIRLEAFTNAASTGAAAAFQVLPNAPSQAYYLNLAAGTFYLRAFVDVFGDSTFLPWEEKGTLGPVIIAGSSVTGQNFSIAVDSIAPNSPLGLTAAPSAGQVLLTWAAPTTSTNGAVLQDLRGYIVQRSTSAVFANLGGTASAPLSSATLTFVDPAPIPTAVNYYRVAAVDFSKNVSQPSAPASVGAGAAASGGTISGRISSFTTTTSGLFRVRLSSVANGAVLAETTQNPFSFVSLSSGTYYLAGFRDLDGDGAQASLEPAGSFGGLHNDPFPVYISGGNTITADVIVCDRAPLPVGSLVTGTLSASGCPAPEAGAGRFTNPLVFEAGTAAVGAVALNTPLIANMSRIDSGASVRDSRLVVLGPGGQVVASNSSPGGAAVSFAPAQAGVYVVLPTSFDPGVTGGYTLRMSSAPSGSDPGQISGTLSYSGAQTGSFILRFFDNASFAGIPLATQTVASAGAFSRVSLPLGTYFVDGFRDTSGAGVFNPAYQAYGRCNAGSGVTLTAGAPVVAIGTCVISDPAAAAAGSSSISGALTYRGALTGTLRAALFPLGSANPIGSISAAMTPSVPSAYSFSGLSSGTYLLRAFLDGDADFVPDAGEPVAMSTATGIALLSAASASGQNLILCDRQPIIAGVPVTASWTASDCPGPDRGGAFTRLYTFLGTRGQPITLAAEASGFYGTFLGVYGPDGTLVAQDDGGASADGNARLAALALPQDGLFTVAASPYAANVTGQIKLSLQGSSGALGSLSGSVSYSGSQGGRMTVGLFNALSFSSTTQVGTAFVSSAAAYAFGDLATGTTYYLGAFVDVNYNLVPDAGEDRGLFGGSGQAAPLLLLPGQNLQGIDIVVAPSTATAGSGAYVSGSIGYAGGQSLGSAGQLRVEFWSDSLFSGNPVALRTLPNGTTPYAYDAAVPGGQSYFVRAYLDANSDLVLNPNEPRGVYAPRNQGAEAVYAPAATSVSGVDFAIVDPFVVGGNTATVAGEGSASLSMSTVAAGAVFSATITYTAGAAGIGPGGRIGFIAPPGFSFPQAVTATTISGTAAYGAVSLAGPSASVRVNSGSLAAGQQMRFNYNAAYAPCAPSTHTFVVVSASSGTVPQPLFAAGASTLTLAVVAGPPAHFAPRNPYFSLTQYERSSAQPLEARDACGNRTAVAGAPATVSVRAKTFDYLTGQFAADAAVVLSASPADAPASTLDLAFSVGQASSAFYVVSTATGNKSLELFYDLGAQSTFYYGFTVLPSNALTNVSVSTSVAAVGRSSATITLNPAFINFDLGDPNQPWHVAVSSIPNRESFTATPVWETWGYGQPSRGLVAWDGRYSPWVNSGARVPAGLYYVRVEVGGSGVHDDSVQVRVNALQLAGRFFDGGLTPSPPLAGARVQVFGPSGNSAAQSDGQGAFVLPGAAAGVYNMLVSRPDYLDGSLSLTLTAAGTVSTVTALSAASSATLSGTGVDIYMSRALNLRVVPSLAVGVSSQAFDQWGSLQVRSSTSAAAPVQLFAALRLPAGTTTFDDGGQWDPATQQFVTRTSMKFNVPIGTYTVEGTFPGLARSSASVYVPAAGATLALNPFSGKAEISGSVSLPAASNPAGTFVSVNAVPTSTAASAVGGFGGLYLLPSETSGTYRIGGLDAGAYMVRANAQNFGAVSSGPVTVTGGQNLANIDLPAFASGGQLSGNATINFNTAGKSLTLYVNAWSPGSLNFGSTQVYVNGGGAGLNIPYLIKGLDAVPYQMFVSLSGVDGDVNTVQPQPLTVTPTAVQNFAFERSSGTVAGTIILPAGNTDFFNVAMFGRIVGSLKPQEVGREFEEATSTGLPSFACVPAGAVVSGSCPAGSSTATFVFSGLNTQTVDITMLYRRTGETRTRRMSVVNGSTTTIFVDLTAPTYSISGSLNNQITNGLFNTNPSIVANAPFIAPPGWPASLSSTTARVLAIRQSIADVNSAIATDYNPAETRVGFLTAAGTFTVSNVPAGVYYVRTNELRSCATCPVVVPAVGRLIRVSNADVSSVTFTLSDGYGVSGSISLDGGLLDSRVFNLTVRNRRQEVVRSTAVYLGDSALGATANSVLYAFSNLPPNEFYTLSVVDRGSPARYAGRPVSFPDPSLSPSGLQADAVNQNLTLQRAAYIVGRLKDANTGELIGKSNAGLLASNFRISATANPWIEGGFVLAESSVAGRPIQDDGYFRVGPLIPGYSYDLRLGQSSWDAAFLAQGSQNYTPVTVGGLKPGAGQSMDAGVISLNQGQSLTGYLYHASTSGAVLGNIKITARPSFGTSDVVVQTFTNPLGKYTLWVSTFLSNQYDVTAAPRDGNQASNGLYYGEFTRHNVSLLATTTADFLLNPLLASVTGQILVEDAASGGELSYPFGAQRGFPAAAINMQRYGVVPTKNPLGDIEAATDGRGLFTVPGLSTGSYALRAASLNYIVFNATVAVSTGSFRVFTGSDTPANYVAGNVLTLRRGATVAGRILKSDGSAPNSTEVGGVAAANFAAGEFVIGSVDVDPTAKTVSAYSISGFKTNVSYDLVILPPEKTDDVIFPDEGRGISFATSQSTLTKSVNLTFASAGIDCAATTRALGNSQFQVKIDCTKALRSSLPADDDLDQILTVSTYTSAGAAFVSPNGTGQLLGADKSLTADRRRITAIYRAAAGEAAFSLRLRAAAVTVNPKTGENFSLDKVFDFHTGVDANVVARVTNMQGGSVELQPSAEDETLGLDERSRLDLQSGTFAQEGETNAASTITVSVGMRKGKDRQTISALYARRLGYTPASVEALRPSSYPSEMAAAMTAYRTLASTKTIGGANPLSSFYDIFLPAGIRHQLKQNADLTLSYTLACDTCTAADNINVWFYNATTGKYVLENRNRRVDTVNKTVTVSVDHFSVFTVLDSTPVASVANLSGLEDITVVNFPNPADCIVHSNIPFNTSLFPAGAGVHAPFRGTMLRFSLPGSAAEFQEAKINIYNVAGELVKTLRPGVVQGQFTHYVPWDCSSDGGGTVSSGVYIGEVQWGGKRKFVKIAIIKGSGL